MNLKLNSNVNFIFHNDNQTLHYLKIKKPFLVEMVLCFYQKFILDSN